MKGVSPTVSVVFLIAIAVIVSVSIYYWAAGQDVTPPEESELIKIDATILDTATGNIQVTNIDTQSFGNSKNESVCGS